MNFSRARVMLAAVIAAGAGMRSTSAAGASQDEAGAPVMIAAAANLVYAMDALNGEFGGAHPRVRLSATSGASGTLVAQIQNGAPYDVFLSADRGFAERLVQGGQAPAASLRVFAVGRLVLWTVKPGLEMGSIGSVVRNPAVGKIAIANPESAPYGQAAMQALERMGLLEAARPKLVRGENISQAAEFVETGNADAGFVAMSIVVSPRLKERGRWLEVPSGLFAPLEQAAILTRRGSSNAAAQAYLDFLGGAAAARILEAYGYRLPR